VLTKGHVHFCLGIIPRRNKGRGHLCNVGNEGDRHIMPHSTEVAWFASERRRKYLSQKNQPLGVGIVAKMLDLVKFKVEEQDNWVAMEYYKFGAAAALAVCGSLQGPEVFMLDLAGL
jgi:hypothetical protein